MERNILGFDNDFFSHQECECIVTYHKQLENPNFDRFFRMFSDTSFFKRLEASNDDNIIRLVGKWNSLIEVENLKYADIIPNFSILFFALEATEIEKNEIQFCLDTCDMDAICKIPSLEYLSTYHYDSENDYIAINDIPQAPYSSWSYDIHTSRWYPPTPKPELTEEEKIDRLDYKWDEDSLSWNLVSI